MKRIFLLSTLLLILALAGPSAYAVGETCSDPDGAGPLVPNADCCTAPDIIEDYGGCPAGTVWLGDAYFGQCQTPPTCNATHTQFKCASSSTDGKCYKPPVSAPPPVPDLCPSSVLDTDSDLPCCTDGQIAVRDSTAGSSWTCMDLPAASGDLTDVLAGTGITVSNSGGPQPTVSANTTYLQRRVTGTCAAGSSIRVVNDDGTVTCETDDSGTSLWTESGSNVYRSSGRVGIGTTSPDEKLSVIGRIRAANDSGESEYTEIAHGGSNGYINTVGDGNLEFRHDGSALMYLTSAGDVGIGVSSPATPLAIRGNGGSNPVGITQNAYGGSSTMELTTEDSGGDQASRIVLRGGSDGADIELLRGAQGSETPSVFIEGANGNVGIGTNSPGAGLHIKRDGWPSSFVFLDTNANNQDVGIRFYENGAVRQHIYNSASTDTLHIDPGGAAGIAIASNGNVGIGTANPLSKLQVEGTGTQGVYVGTGYQTGLQVGGASQTGISAKGNTYGVSGSSDYGTSLYADTYSGTGLHAYARATSATTGVDVEGGFDRGIYIRSRSSFWPDTGIDANAWIEAGRFTNGYRNTDVVISGQSYGVDSQGYTGGGRFRDSNSTGSIRLGYSTYSLYADEGNAYFEDRVGIGTTSPSYKLDVAGNLNINKGISGYPALYVNGSEALWYNGTYFSWGYGSSYNYFARSVGIWKIPSTSYALDTGGSIRVNSTVYSSDERFKENIKGLSNQLEKVLNLRPVEFEWKTDEFADRNFADGVQIGLIAQEVESVIPEVVSTDDEGYKSIDYARLAPINSAAIQELKAEIDALKEALCEIKPEAELCQ